MTNFGVMAAIWPIAYGHIPELPANCGRPIISKLYLGLQLMCSIEQMLQDICMPLYRSVMPHLSAIECGAYLSQATYALATCTCLACIALPHHGFSSVHCMLLQYHCCTPALQVKYIYYVYSNSL